MTQEPITPTVVRPCSASTPRGLHGLVVELLGTQIVSGLIEPDALLQPEQVGAAYEVSRTVVREALRVLEHKGLISARPNVGTRIRPVEQWNLLDADVIRWRAVARREELLDHDILDFTQALRALRPQLDGNALYEQLMENLTGVPRARPEDAEVDAATVNTAVPPGTALEEEDRDAAVMQLAEAAA